MGRHTVFFGLLLSMAISLVSRTETMPRLSGPYLGQKPPGPVPEIFAPGIISSGESEGCSGWGRNMEYFIFQRWENRKSRLYIMSQEKGTWSSPAPLPFADTYQVGDFTIAPDGLTMAFASNIMVEGIGSAGEGGNVWLVKKKGHGWNEPYPLKPPLNTKYHDSYPSLAANENIYFFSRRPGGCGQSDLYMSKFLNGAYQDPVNLGDILNSEYHEWDSYIAPDESYMIYCSMMPNGLGEDDLYVAFRQIDGSWGKPIHMGSVINSDQSENRPYVSHDGKYLFYTSSKTGNRDIYWVDAGIIEELHIRNSVVSDYVNGLKTRDFDLIRGICISDARLQGVSDNGELNKTTLDQWSGKFDQASPPFNKLEHEITRIDIEGTAAQVKIRFLISEKIVRYDYLNLLKVGGRWRIVNIVEN